MATHKNISIRHHFKLLHFLSITAVALLGQQSARAVDYSWAAPMSGDASVAANWTPNGVPGMGDTSTFNLGSAGYTVSVPLNQLISIEVGALYIGTDKVTFNANGGTINYDTISLGRKTGDVANLTLINAAVQSTNGLGGAVGDASGSVANVIVGNSQFSGFLGATTIGNAGTGMVNVVRGSTGAEYLGFASGSQGTVVVDGTKSSWSTGGSIPTYIGDGGTGSLTIQNGAAATANGEETYIANQSGSQGTLKVTGLGSTWSNRDALYIGYGGTGAMSIASGATASPQFSTDIGYLTGSNGSLTVDGTDSKFTNSDQLTVGTQGTGSISITSGGSLSASNIVIGAQSGSQGSMSITGTGSTLTTTSSGVKVGSSGTGTFTISGGADANLTGGIGIGTAAGGSGSVSVDGAGTQLTAGVGLGTAGSGAASLSVTNGASFVGALTYRTGATGPLSATFSGTGTTATTPMTLTFGTGTLKIQDGAVVNTATSGTLATGAITTTVSGAGSRWNLTPNDQSAGLGIGSAGLVAGSLTVSNGAAVNVGVVLNSGFGTVDVFQNSLLNIQQGTLTAASVQNSGTFRVDGTVNANVNSGGLLSGSGTINGKLEFAGTVQPGDSPGTLSAGATTWDAGGVFKLAINDANGTAGSTQGWGLLSVNGSAELNSTPHVISLESLTASNAPGAVSDFDPTHNYSWTFLTTTGHLFDTAGFTVDTSGFDNPIYGQFSVTATGQSLVLNYTAPEPSTFVLAALGITIGYGLRRKGRRAH